MNNPVDLFLHTEALPTCWCSGCGIGAVVNLFLQAVNESEVRPEDMIVLSTGMGCTGKVTDYLRIQSDVVVEGNVVDHALKLTDGNTQKKVVIFLDDVDYIVSGVEAFIQAGVKGSDLLIVYFNNYIYRIFVEHRELKKWSPRGLSPERSYQSPFNIPRLGRYCGASYIARWTPHHPRRLVDSITRGLKQPAFSMIEVISPCLMYFTNAGKIGESIDRKEIFLENTVIRNVEDTEMLDLRCQEKIIVGQFRDSKD